MAASLKFKVKGAEFEAAPVKVERKKLYGWTETVATDASGAACRTAQVDPDGELLIPPGAVKLGLLDEDGAWVDRSELVAVDAEGKELPIVPSSFGQTIELEKTATAEEFLDHAWKSVYQLDGEGLAEAVGEAIYAFPFNYRADASPEDGFLLASGGKAFLFAGEKLKFEFIGLEEEGVLDDPAEEPEAEEEDFDFGMM
jgi:hypothetical protein